MNLSQPAQAQRRGLMRKPIAPCYSSLAGEQGCSCCNTRYSTVLNADQVEGFALILEENR